MTVHIRPSIETSSLGRSDGKFATGVNEIPTTATRSRVEPLIRKTSGICGEWGDSEVAAPLWRQSRRVGPGARWVQTQASMYIAIHCGASAFCFSFMDTVRSGFYFSFMVSGIGGDGGTNSLHRYACTGAPAEMRLARDLHGRFIRYGSE